MVVESTLNKAVKVVWVRECVCVYSFVSVKKNWVMMEGDQWGCVGSSDYDENMEGLGE